MIALKGGLKDPGAKNSFRNNVCARVQRRSKGAQGREVWSRSSTVNARPASPAPKPTQCAKSYWYSLTFCYLAPHSPFCYGFRYRGTKVLQTPRGPAGV